MCYNFQNTLTHLKAVYSTPLDPQKRGSLVGVETCNVGGKYRVFQVDSARTHSNYINLVASTNQNRCYSVNIHQSGFAHYGMQIFESAEHGHQVSQLLRINLQVTFLKFIKTAQHS